MDTTVTLVSQEGEVLLLVLKKWSIIISTLLKSWVEFKSQSKIKKSSTVSMSTTGKALEACCRICASGWWLNQVDGDRYVLYCS